MLIKCLWRVSTRLTIKRQTQPCAPRAYHLLGKGHSHNWGFASLHMSQNMRITLPTSLQILTMLISVCLETSNLSLGFLTLDISNHLRGFITVRNSLPISFHYLARSQTSWRLVCWGQTYSELGCGPLSVDRFIGAEQILHTKQMVRIPSKCPGYQTGSFWTRQGVMRTPKKKKRGFEILWKYNSEDSATEWMGERNQEEEGVSTISSLGDQIT